MNMIGGEDKRLSKIGYLLVLFWFLILIYSFNKMSRELFTFYSYVNTVDNRNTEMFRRIFGTRLKNMSDSGSSKKFIHELGISNHFDRVLFKNTYMDYFRNRMGRDLQ